MKFTGSVLLFLLLLAGYQTQAQSPVDSTARVHSVHKATLLSTFLPGAGQVYNRKVWKVPIIYAAFAGMGYLVKTNHDNYKKYNNALIARLDGDSTTVDTKYEGVYTDANLRSLSDYYHRNRDLSIAVTALVYVLNIIDAHVDAHLFTFNTDDNLSMTIDPQLTPTWGSASEMGFQSGLKLTMRF